MRRFRLWPAIVQALAFGGLWWVLTGGETASWLIGAPAVALVLGWNLRQDDTLQPLPSLSGFIGFIGYFLRESLRGGIDVALLALSPTLTVRPHFDSYRLRLPDGAARRVFINTVSLLPGTLSADLHGRSLIVHRLREVPHGNTDLHDCEQRVARLFGMALPDVAARPPTTGARRS